jgi:hypothetical protein
VVHFQQLNIPPQFIGKNYDQDGEYRLQFQGWINQLWLDKDALLEQLHHEFPGKH